MKDPPRLFDDPSLPAEHRRLLLAAVPPPPMSAIHQQAFASLVGKLLTGGAIGKLVAAPLAAKLFVVSTTMSVAMLTGYMATAPRSATVPSRVVSEPQSQIHTPVGLAAPNQQPQSAASSTGAANEDSSNVIGVTVSNLPAVRELAAAPSSRENSIREEAAMLERARLALSESPLRALFLADEHAERFTSGQLAAERELIAVQALVSLGRQQQAEQRARRFSMVFTSSVYQRRLRQVLGAANAVE